MRMSYPFCLVRCFDYESGIVIRYCHFGQADPAKYYGFASGREMLSLTASDCGSERHSVSQQVKDFGHLR